MICPVCKVKDIPKNSRFCHMCGVNLAEALKKEAAELERKQRAGMIPLTKKVLNLGGRKKTIQVLCKDVTEMDQDIDLLTISAFPYEYEPTERSLIGALFRKLGISVNDLAEDPLFDLRREAGCWISKDILPRGRFRKIGGVEIMPRMRGEESYEKRLLKSIKSYMHLLDILTEYEQDIRVVAFPLLGAGDQQLNYQIMIFPIINEVIKMLERNPYIEKVIFVEWTFEKAQIIANALEQSYQVQSETEEFQMDRNVKQNVFISYTEKGDRETADLIRRCLEGSGVSYWYAPENINVGDYATEIVKGIKSCTHFICVVSENSMKSKHVMNEVDLAFKRIDEGVKIIPLRLDASELVPAFEYYLSRMNWKICPKPLTENLMNEMLKSCISSES